MHASNGSDCIAYSVSSNTQSQSTSSRRPSLGASLACLALYRMMCTMTRFLSGCLCLSQRAAHARWGPSDFAPQVPMKLWLTSGCWNDIRCARGGASDLKPASPIRLPARLSCCMEMRCARWGPSDSTPSAPMLLWLRSRHWMDFRCVRWGPRSFTPSVLM